MAPLESYAAYKHFIVSQPAPYVGHVEINRPEKLNSFVESMWLEMRTVFRQLSTDPDVRAVVLSGAGDRALLVQTVQPMDWPNRALIIYLQHNGT
jgi:Delta3,5-Delta2,4-dienoyl-CoA isomerase